MTIFHGPQLSDLDQQAITDKATLERHCDQCGWTQQVPPSVVIIELKTDEEVHATAIFGSAADFCDFCGAMYDDDEEL